MSLIIVYKTKQKHLSHVNHDFEDGEKIIHVCFDCANSSHGFVSPVGYTEEELPESFCEACSVYLLQLG